MIENNSIKAVKNLLEDENLVRADVTIQPHLVDDNSKINEIVKDIGGADGWICYTDELVVIKAGSANIPDGRIILSAELALGYKSLHIRQYGRGWQVLTLTRTDNDQGDTIMIEECYVSRKISGQIIPALKHEIYWKAKPNDYNQLVFHPYISRFAGFKEVK